MKEEIYMKCQNCGMENADGARFCKGCGGELNQNNGGGMSSGTGSNINIHMGGNMYGEDYTPISMWGYFGYELLFGIPCVGFILILIFAFGGTKNVNLRNFARSFLCVYIIAIGFIGIMLISGATLSVFSGLR